MNTISFHKFYFIFNLSNQFPIHLLPEYAPHLPSIPIQVDLILGGHDHVYEKRKVLDS